jgi:hypothetical protein
MIDGKGNHTMKKTITVSIVGLFTAVLFMTVLYAADENKTVKPLRVGVYDSRCVTVAYVHSKFSENEIQKMFDIVHKAEKEGDTKTAQSTREIAEYMQKQRRLQGFGTAPVQKLLKPINDQLPEVARQAGVDMIVGKWQVDYQVKDAEFVDVTAVMVALYHPDEKTLKMGESMKDVKPISKEEILKIKD